MMSERVRDGTQPPCRLRLQGEGQSLPRRSHAAYSWVLLHLVVLWVGAENTKPREWRGNGANTVRACSDGMRDSLRGLSLILLEPL